MNVFAVGPAVLAITVALGAAAWHRRLHPALAARLLTASAAAAALATYAVGCLLALAFLARVLPLAAPLRWCRGVLRVHHAVPPVIGTVALLGVAAMTEATRRAWVRRRRALAASEALVLGTTPWPVVVPLPGVDAYAVPGRPGRVVVTTATLQVLDEDELRALMAHERSHLRHRHDRYTGAADLAAAAAPFLRPLRSRVCLATERWADEDAAADVGDRRLVARALAKAALASLGATHTAAAAFAGSQVRARVEALLEVPPEPGGPLGVRALGTAGFSLGAGGATVQLHHLAALALHACVL